MTALLPWLCGHVQSLNQPQLPREHTAVAAIRRIELIKLFQPGALCYGLGEPVVTISAKSTMAGIELANSRQLP